MFSRLVLNEEREVRSRGPVRYLLLLAVLNAFDEAGETQYVLRHALAPLTAALSAGENLVEAARLRAQQLGLLLCLARDRLQLDDALAALAVDLAHQLAQFAKLLANLGEALVDLALASLELLLTLRGRAIDDGLVMSNQLLDARFLDLSLSACEI